MTKGNPIEILMAAYDGAPYIREQIDSKLAQTDGGEIAPSLMQYPKAIFRGIQPEQHPVSLNWNA